MTQLRNGAGLTPVTKQTRGDALRTRMLALGLDESKLARKVKKDRGTIRRLFDGTASDLTYDQMEVWFDREEAKMGIGFVPEPATERHERRPVTIRMEEGGSIVVEGPLDTPEDAELLKNLARDLIREWKSTNDTPDP